MMLSSKIPAASKTEITIKTEENIENLKPIILSKFTEGLHQNVLVCLLMVFLSVSLFAQQSSVDSIVSRSAGEDTIVSLEPMRVSAHKDAQLGPLGDVAIKDVPFSLNVTTGESIENRGAHILADALGTDPTVAPVQQPHTDGRGGSEMSIRGFDPSYQFDGLIIRNTLPVAVENLDRIEVLNGLSGMLYGFGLQGGTMNFVRKKPTAEPLGIFAVGRYNGGVNFINTDFGGPFDQKKLLTYRVNAYLEDGKTFTDGSSRRGSNFYGVFDLSLFNTTAVKTHLLLTGSYQDMLLQGQQAAFIVDPANVTVPDASDFDTEKLYGQPWTYVKGRQGMVGGAVESKLGSIFTFRGAYNYSALWRKNNGVSATLIDNDGTYTATYSDGAPSDVYEHSAYSLLDADIGSENIHNKITLGWTFNGYTQENNPGRVRNLKLGTFYGAHPSYVSMPDTVAPVDKTQKTRPLYNSALICDMFTYRIFSLLAGVNYTRYNYKIENGETGEKKESEQTKISPAFALTIKLVPFISAYGSYMQGVTAGDATSTPWAKNVNEELDPAVHSQVELGVKARVFKALDLTAAGFRINKVNEFLDPADSIYKQDGREIHQGLEVTVGGKFFKCLSLGGGATLLDAHVVKAEDTTIEDKTPANIPEKLGTVFLEYDIPGISGLSISSGATYNGSRWIDGENTTTIPAVWVYDAGVRYSKVVCEHPLTINLRIANLLNTMYWAAYKPKGTVGLCLGAPRQISLSAKYEW